MLHPSYADLRNVVNSGVEPGEQPVVQSRYDGRVKIIGDSEEDIEEDKVQEEQKEEEGQ